MIQSKNPRITSISILKDEQASGNGKLTINAAGEQNPAFSFFGKTESARTKWNQLAKELNGTNYRAYTAGNLTVNFTNGVADCTVQNASVSGYQVGVRATDNITIVNGHIYFAFCEINSQKNTSFRVNLNSGSNNFNGGARLTVNTFVKCSVIITASRDYTQFIVSPNEAFSVGQKYSVKNMMLIDLTAIFGSGNEPATPAAFEAYCEQYGIDLTAYQPQMTDGYNGYVHNNDSVWEDGKGGRISLADYDLREINGIRDEYDASTGTITRRIGKVDLGTLNYTRFLQTDRYLFDTTSDLFKATNNGLCVLYAITPQSTGYGGMKDKEIRFGAGRIRLRNDTYTDVNSFKTAMSGVFLYYELATPVTESVQMQTMPAVPGNNIYTQTDGAVNNTPASVRYKGADEITDGIASGTLDIDEMLCNDPLTFGNMCASKFECDLYKDIDIAGKEIEIRQTIDGTSIPVFHGYVDSAKKDYSQSYRQIVAYDGAEKLRDTDISAFWESFWSTNTTATLKVLISALCASQGYVIDDKRPLGFHDIAITKPFDLADGAKMAFGDCLRYLCEICLYHPHISRDGKKITLYSLNATGKAINNLIDKYNRAGSDFEDYVTKPIERILFYEDGQTRADVGAGNTLVIDNNPILYAFTDAQLATLGNAMIAELAGCVFRPARIEMIISAPDLQLADTVYTEYGRTYILNNSLHGIQLFDQSIRADADEEQAAPIQYNAEVRRKLSQADFTGAAIADRINNAPETVVIEADHINLNGAITANGNVKINVDGSIEAKAGRFGLWDIGATGKLEAINKGVTTGYIRMADEDRNSLYSEVAIGSQYITLIDEDNRTEDKSFDYKRIDIGLDDDIKFTSSYDGFASKHASYGVDRMQISDFNTGNSVVINDDDINIGFTSPVKWKYVEDGPDAGYVNFLGARYIRFGNLVTVTMEITAATSNVTTRRYFAKLPKPVFSVGVQAISKSDGKPISGASYYLRESDGLLSNTGSMSTSVTHLLNFSYITNEPETRPFPPFL